jgi:hypothetical protein
VPFFTPSLGTVDALQPVNMPPPDLHEDVCGKNKHRGETAEEEPPPATADPDRSGINALLPPFGTSATKPAIPVLGPPVPSMAPIVVFVGSPKKPGNPETAIAKGEPRKRAKSTKPALAAKSTTPASAPASPHRKKSAPATAAAPTPSTPAAPAGR